MSAYRIASLTVPCPSHKNLNQKIINKINSLAADTDMDAGMTAMAFPALPYRQDKNRTDHL